MGHDECPMAITLKTGHAARGVEAIAERPMARAIHFLRTRRLCATTKENFSARSTC